ncbi:hypothetical protein HV436_01345 [Bacillus sporothermodurans]|uniref:hypothetical protein n=1 Tax=Heyndrickxia sporothermodurans TaxID=46224 RepID=UPI00192A7B86|nr:hypothetical protein [Heyndrickxia sporothermodurans]MBL5776981.1 hypothetical protein [Heyndrickxia sporothermodurans]MBL5798508.1 hypothetical protein [Heyndrickxia sporothermodurans]MBL5809425.1 hypothetical protein [Heyndrickxia sporothermodurans]MBL5813060.1 hypothetical protein [Heyndrickxia sporothermodurans]MBL5816484.1 hypothetical protein [Heyndrickxia sporothermodurans]
MKKHFSQMGKKELEYLKNRFKGIPQGRWKFNSYSKMRAIKRGVDMSVFRSFWTDGFDIVEFHQHEEKKENRLLLRTILTDSNDNQVCAVFNFTTMEVTTVYLNYRKNKHSNLVWSEYDSTISIKDAFKRPAV